MRGRASASWTFRDSWGAMSVCTSKSTQGDLFPSAYKTPSVQQMEEGPQESCPPILDGPTSYPSAHFFFQVFLHSLYYSDSSHYMQL